ncbi:helix-turn-helix domain-containing protein [Microbispora sp. NPDC088329]|uniref:winged helix-turn-helix transcriptional regulator n=1 Tax=Microbispora sp. NPDC088329 TaxID=3154869 RepID=UPI00344A5A96
MLTVTLRQLERDGLVSRAVHATVPPKVEYELTALGATMIEPALTLGAWVIEHLDEIGEHRRRYDLAAREAGDTP